MNYKKPLQRKGDLSWDYTTSNDRTGTYPIGYCAGWRDLGDETISAIYPGGRASESFKKDEALREANRHKYHSNGHATYKEAAECYKNYLLDNDLRLDGIRQHTQSKCKTCGAWTQRYASLCMEQWTLCDEHCNREEVEKLFSVGESFGSY